MTDKTITDSSASDDSSHDITNQTLPLNPGGSRAAIGTPNPPHSPAMLNNPSTFSLDPFDTQDPDLWFQITEMTSPPQLTSYERSLAVLRALPKSITVQIINVLGTLSSALDPYADLKAAIYKSINPHPDEQIKKLLTDTPLGDRKPSELFAHLQSLTKQFSPQIQERLIRPIFLSKLPPLTQTLIAVNKTATLPMVVEIADTIAHNLPSNQLNVVRPTQFQPPNPQLPTHQEPLKYHPPYPQVQIPHSHPTHPQNFVPLSSFTKLEEDFRNFRDYAKRLEQKVLDLSCETATLKGQVLALQQRSDYRGRSQSKPSRFPHHNPNPKTTPNPNPTPTQTYNPYPNSTPTPSPTPLNSIPPLNSQNICFYHQRYRDKARMCLQGCTYQENCPRAPSLE